MLIDNSYTKNEIKNTVIVKVLENLKGKDHSILEPSFQPQLGFFYQDIELNTLQEQIKLLESCVRDGAATRGRAAVSILQCSFCNSNRFCVTFSCRICESSNILRGSAIAHRPCGNIEFYDKYVAGGSDGTLLCPKCNKRLKAIGVDYSKLDNVYNCQDCKALFSDINQQYLCLDCGKSSLLEESYISLLHEYTIDISKLSKVVDADNSAIMISVIKELDKVGIKSWHQAAIIGISRMQHTFSLVVYDQKGERPIVVADIIESDDTAAETYILSFIAKCLDAKIEEKIIVIVNPHMLNQGLRELIGVYRIRLVESKTEENTVVELVKAVKEACRII
jgi:hypothetical protein